jgi:hypothetical protein
MPDDQVWNEEFARKLPGAIVLVGLTYTDKEGDRFEQLFGEVVSVDATRGIALRLAGNRNGEIFWLPPDLSNVSQATPGSYRLKSTGDIVENPDFTATWTIHPKST